ncbi:hypothetical protein [Avibacterium paragallinarum]|uniref:hypothetical protein n=1 Tax=Avibacterium paragallinarum TaxID=728 RepID=UPI001C998F3C|nr:hypothetical protein [Avibacterium paragallinarum]QZP16512.1 hypothetical protein K5O18_04165 [Avibacterium paragallinarum]
MPNSITLQAFKQEQMLARFSEVESLIFLKHYIENSYGETDLTLVHSFNLLTDGALMDLYQAITLEPNQTDSKAEVSNER